MCLVTVTAWLMKINKLNNKQTQTSLVLMTCFYLASNLNLADYISALLGVIILIFFRNICWKNLILVNPKITPSYNFFFNNFCLILFGLLFILFQNKVNFLFDFNSNFGFFLQFAPLPLQFLFDFFFSISTKKY